MTFNDFMGVNVFVKAAGVVCVLGIGFGLGTLLIYKLYYKYIQPILDRNKDSEESDPNSEDDNYCFYVDNSDAESNENMGNTNSYSVAEAFYNPEFGVAFGTNRNYKKKKPAYGLNLINQHDVTDRKRPEGVIFRNRKPRQNSSEEHSDRDSAIGGVSDLGQSFYSESGINRDSFYSTCTAESGFENMPDSGEDGSSVSGRYPFRYRHTSSTHSMNVNFSPKSLKEKHMRYLNGSPHEGSSESLHSFEALEKSSVLLTPPSDDETSPAHVGHKTGSHVCGEKRNGLAVDVSDRSRSPNVECDQLPDVSESLKSFSGGTNSIGDWSCDEEGEVLSPLRHIHTSLSDYQFKQSVLQRLHEWSSLSSEIYLSRSPTPDRPHGYTMRRSRSLDRRMSDSFSMDCEIFENASIDFEESTTKNLELIEDELHDIQDEFSVITSKLGDLIRPRSVSLGKSDSESRTLTDDQPMSPITASILHKTLSRWERSPSISLDSNRCSREGSIDLAWDLCELADSDMPCRLRSVRTHTRLSVSGRASSNNNSTPDDTAALVEVKDTLPTADNTTTTTTCDVDTDDTCTTVSSLPSADLQVDSEPATEAVPHRSIEQPNVRLKNIGEVLDIQTYAASEWKGETAVAEKIKQGYAEISDIFKCPSLRRIRGDNYCAIRSVLYQVLVSGINVTSNWSGIVDLVNNLNTLFHDSATGLAKWNFANRLPCSSDEERLSVICKCVVKLYSTFEDICKLPSREEREDQMVGLLNWEPTTDLELEEGVKIMMLVDAVELNKANLAGQDVPIFVWLMFARDTSETVDKFVTNHLNCVGDSAGLEQVEMCLLGHTLGARIRVARLQNHGQEDFICQFPDDADPLWPQVDLLAEDDRHYNIPVP
ncbi:uncharacterized protein LOC121381083 isoform X2 [Gigantopelta aegis]|uniref:uncharacterized protein LOC121381083 isoform X2 n=1 Tax=Gigantopelta aegis TaxID=1735272 RepID=UPI001B88CEEE|nr:uncharacterized protein LOC121381083 isoform X2 [Gigantopelta aegis]